MAQYATTEHASDELQISKLFLNKQIKLTISSSDCINKRTYRVFCEFDGYKFKRLYSIGYPVVWCFGEQIITNEEIINLLEESFRRKSDECVIVYTPVFIDI